MDHGIGIITEVSANPLENTSRDRLLFVQVKKEERQQRQRDRMDQVRSKRLLEAAARPITIRSAPKPTHMFDSIPSNKNAPVKLLPRKSLCFPVKQTNSSKLRLEKVNEKSKSVENIANDKSKFVIVNSNAPASESSQAIESADLTTQNVVFHKKVPIQRNKMIMKTRIPQYTSQIGNSAKIDSDKTNNLKQDTLKLNTFSNNSLNVGGMRKDSGAINTQKGTNVHAKVNIGKEQLFISKTNPNTNFLKVPNKFTNKSSATIPNVFERLYKPKSAADAVAPLHLLKPVSKALPASNVSNKLTKRPISLASRRSVSGVSNPIPKKLPTKPMRRSLSAVHFRRVSSNEVFKFGPRSISVNSVTNAIDEESEVTENKAEVVLRVKSDIKKSVKFLTPVRNSSTPMAFLNTPRPAILRKRLADWLLKRGKSMSSFHHLQCFGIRNSPASLESKEALLSVITIPSVKQISPQPLENIGVQSMDEENKENIEIVDDASLSEILDSAKFVKTEPDMKNWRNASYDIISDTISSIDGEATDEFDSILTPERNTSSKKQYPMSSTEITSALGDLLQLIIEGYPVHQCAEWLGAIKRRCPDVTLNSSYWECRAAIEDKRGDFYKAVDCWKRAIEEGVQPSTAEVNLDGILDKFMKLNLSPSNQHTIDPKLVDVKNIFKSTIIRFAINHRKEKKKSDGDVPKYTATPVRRCSRLLKTAPMLHINSTEKMITKNKETNSHPNGERDNGKDGVGDKTPEANIPKIATPFRKSAQRSAKRTPLVQLCSSLRNIDNDIKESLIFVPNKALEFNDSP